MCNIVCIPACIPLCVCPMWHKCYVQNTSHTGTKPAWNFATEISVYTVILWYLLSLFVECVEQTPMNHPLKWWLVSWPWVKTLYCTRGCSHPMRFIHPILGWWVPTASWLKVQGWHLQGVRFLYACYPDRCWLLPSGALTRELNITLVYKQTTINTVDFPRNQVTYHLHLDRLLVLDHHWW